MTEKAARKATTSDMEAKYRCYVTANALESTSEHQRGYFLIKVAFRPLSVCSMSVFAHSAYRAALKGDWSCLGHQLNIGKGLGMQQAARRSRMSYKESSDEISEAESAA